MTAVSRGIFITVEGVEGVGKTTNIQYIAEQLSAAGVDIVLTREPGGTPLAESIREVLLESREEPVAENTELLLMFAARAQHIAQVIEPALAKGQWVICDRFTDATFAYQGAVRGIAMSKIADLEQWVQGELCPSYTLLLDAPVEVGLARAKKRAALDRFEKEEQQFFLRVREGYLALARAHQNRYRIVDASRPLKDVQAQISLVIDEMIKQIGR